MKVIQKRIYTALPRVSTPTASSPAARARSNSLYAPTSILPHSFDSPPPPNGRPILSANRLSVEAKAQSESGTHHSHSSALTAPTNSSTLSLSLSPAQSALFAYPHFPSFPYGLPAPSNLEPPVCAKRHKQRYQLDVAAYGIPKRSKAADPNSKFAASRTIDDMDLSVQVGEDAYFIRDNAMGVADGVGGWARCKHHKDVRTPSLHSPSALFARRLMHYCSAELEFESRKASASASPSFVSPKSSPKPGSPSTLPFGSHRGANSSRPVTELASELEDSLEALEEGIDVLMILERAYERTVKAHVVPAPTPSPPLDTTIPISPSLPPTSPLNCALPTDAEPHMIPLLSGSSTALIAVLDHVPPLNGPSIAATDGPDHGCDAVIKIAHIGDCMGMLVRGEEIAWRSDEMWWNFNTPVQLAPPNPSSSRLVTPSNAAHLFTLPVRADDILILASDGLSDNLWDEDVLDEVVRFRRSFLDDSASPNPDGTIPAPVTPTERLLRRRTLAGMLSEALCSRARRVSERKASSNETVLEDEVPFARRAREAGKAFRGGKTDDISVIVAVISPAGELNSR
ncbi:hypothetical protein AX16_007888 [Volvariella volvacea WC 439]|nr:hypothetical protein AX16_007888 [Volvariella volvacea WC 439]